ncbi:MAG: rhodanese-related sulfurtransferase [Chloroflexaceae bacterium]|nr:rhodanese-related sulfurtransferase [Chloroflexaceae bacterium]
MSAIPQISPSDLADRLGTSDSPLQLIDVREPEEVAIVSLPGFTVLPLSQFEQWSGQISQRFDPQVETLVLCHHGVRSGQMCHWLQTQGFSNVKNIAGGIDAYAIAIAPSLRRY